LAQSKLKKKRHAEILNACPVCIYCGGSTPATTIDHMPPIAMFDGRQRPKGLEFASCEACNKGTRAADLVASLLGRVYPDPTRDTQAEDFRKLLRGVRNNVPGLLEEMHISDRGQMIQRQRTGIGEGGGFIHGGGPLVSNLMKAFAVKLGFAMHYHATNEAIPVGGGVSARWFSNVDRATDVFPQTIFKLLPELRTLKQGKVAVEDQFQFSTRCLEDKSMGVYLGTFRRSFAVVAFGIKDRAHLSDAAVASGARIYAPGEILLASI
jgi:hypothetical protein